MTNGKPGDGGIKHRIAHTFFFKLWYLNNLRIFMLGVVCLEELRGIGSDCRPRAFGEVDGPVRRRLFGDCRVRSGPGHLAALPTRGASRGPSTSYRAPSSENYFRPELEHALAHWSHSREKLGPLCASTPGRMVENWQAQDAGARAHAV